MRRIKWWMVFCAGFVIYCFSPDVGGIVGTVGAMWGFVVFLRWAFTRLRNITIEVPKVQFQMRKANVRLPDWFTWDDSIHRAEGQSDRIERAVTQDLPVLRKKKNGTFFVRGTKGDIYIVSYESCTCKDFTRRGLPCKHMYAIAIREGLFDPAPFSKKGE